jgi:LysM repeat protein
MSNTIDSRPVSTGTAIAGAVLHRVRRGETLESIAKKYGISPQEIVDANPRIQDNPNGLAIGMTLAIPRVGDGGREVKQNGSGVGGERGRGMVSQFDDEPTFPSPVTKRTEPALPQTETQDNDALYSG